MDAILDPGYIGARPAGDELKGLIRREIVEAGSYEEKLNRARVTGQEQAFAIGVRLLRASSRRNRRARIIRSLPRL